MTYPAKRSHIILFILRTSYAVNETKYKLNM